MSSVFLPEHRVRIPPFIYIIFIQGHCSFSDNLCWCFLKTKTRKGGQDTSNISQVKKKSAKPLRRELELYREKGISLYLDGSPSTPKKIAKACQIAENGGYMRDYTEDEEGHIACVSFDFIRNI
ncbi:hypothetical protein WMO28_07995 [Blautia sp. CLA-JM-H16]|uniref:Uncharacterized protein n=1 Tax=Blautia aquisgranensis TaxID=3133153 RepID=A0ABV1BFC9_9FIRM